MFIDKGPFAVIFDDCEFEINIELSKYNKINKITNRIK